MPLIMGYGHGAMQIQCEEKKLRSTFIHAQAF